MAGVVGVLVQLTRDLWGIWYSCEFLIVLNQTFEFRHPGWEFENSAAWKRNSPMNVSHTAHGAYSWIGIYDRATVKHRTKNKLFSAFKIRQEVRPVKNGKGIVDSHSPRAVFFVDAVPGLHRRLTWIHVGDSILLPAGNVNYPLRNLYAGFRIISRRPRRSLADSFCKFAA